MTLLLVVLVLLFGLVGFGFVGPRFGADYGYGFGGIGVVLLVVVVLRLLHVI